MARIIPNGAERNWLKHGLGIPRSASQFLKLYVNDVFPDEDSIESTFEEASGGGYLANQLSQTWIINPIFDGGEATRSLGLSDPSTKFSFTGPLDNNDTVFGWYMTSQSGLLAVERFVNPFTPVNNGDVLTIPIKFQMTNEPA